MKKIIFTTCAVALLALSSCSGHSEADKQQLQDAHQQAHEMLDASASASATRPAAPESAARVAPADTVK